MSAWGEEGSPVDVGLGFKVCLGLRMGDSGVTFLYGEGFGRVWQYKDRMPDRKHVSCLLGSSGQNKSIPKP